MARYPVEFGGDDANVLHPLGHFQAEQALHPRHVGEVVRDRGEVIRPIRVRDNLLVTTILEQLLQPSMHVADVRHHFFHDFAIHRDDDPEQAMRGGMLGPDIEDEFVGRGLRRETSGFHYSTSGSRIMFG